MPNLEDFFGCFCQDDNSTLSELSPGKPDSKLSEFFHKESIEWSKFPIASNTMIFTVTLAPKRWNPGNMTSIKNIKYNQQARFEEFLEENKKFYKHVYFCTEEQKNGMYHFHGFIDIKDARSLTVMLARMRKGFGRSEITQPHRAYRDWYDYIHKSESLFHRHNIAEKPILNLI